MRVGILGGTFSPIHHGHVICAQEARLQLELDAVRIMPVGTPPHRQLETDEDPGDKHRLSMVRLAVIGQPGLEISTAELEREGTSYTIDTLTELVDQEPDTQFTLIIGADQAMSFGNWRDPEKIAELADIAVATRVDHNRDEAVQEVIRATGGKEPKAFAMPRVDISSTFIRERIYRGATVAHLVPAGIPELIEEAQLYR
ncbi:MAG: nicotinate-nucleotide adenylyltransferase [Solirubrobacterales bacterium]